MVASVFRDSVVVARSVHALHPPVVRSRARAHPSATRAVPSRSVATVVCGVREGVGGRPEELSWEWVTC